ncbi:hypothetical protein GCM10029976_027770 [Kribbella albertanoniae]|uniref:Uncharacterized protein n=1 Tax=Kribbella albertanoniae TaxID=1266829 RepID=A0A4R4Q588_9ACTN|nr:hypothetical protein [Kribbella albertanoniae]TDC30258.1 hypothetical protein E1261_13765 [Kribbella albertanoniae]
MKQHGDGHWCGHRDITYAAVARLYDRLSRDGLSRQEYSEQLDKAQAYQDRPLGAGVIKNFAGTGKPFVYVGLGPTGHSAYANPDAQRAHFMADPYRRGADNLRSNTEYLFEQLAAAQTAESPRDEMMHLGAAAHALQDSYSGAHAWRELSVYDGDPTARVQSLHVFTPGHVVGLDKHRNTHADEFDSPPANSGSTLAAIEATYRMLRVYETTRGMPPQQAELARRAALDELVRPAENVTVNLHPTPEWAAERDERLALEQAGPGAQRSGELGQLRGVLTGTAAPGRVSPGGLHLPPERAATGVSREIRSEAVGRDG